MIRKYWLSKTERIFNIVIVTGGVSIAVISAMLKADLSGHQSWLWLQPTLLLFQNSAFWLIPLLTLTVGIVGLLKKYFGNFNTWNTVTYLLEKYKKAVFEKNDEAQGDPEYHHRITLYKFVGWRLAPCVFPWYGWMVPVARTGHTTHTMRIPRFRVFPGNPDKAEGVAGQAFAQRRIVPISNLPEITENSEENDLKDYARLGFVSREWIRKRESCVIRSLVGIPIEVKNKPWGVMVIDSRRPEIISSQGDLATMQFTSLAEVLGKLLETKSE